MSANDENPEKNKNKPEKHMWLGYGGYSGIGIPGPVNPGNVRADPSIFDKLFELFGVKEKAPKETEAKHKNK